MKKSTAGRWIAAVASLAMAAGLAACGGGSEGSSDPGSGDGTSEEAPQGESEEFIADLTNAVEIINGQIAEVGDPMLQMMLASDREQPTYVYGMWVMPFYPGDATVWATSTTIQITDGTDFVVQLESAETGKTWAMDQDGNLTEVTE